MKVSLLLVSSILWGSHIHQWITLAEEEAFEYADQEEEAYVYYYEDESTATSKTTEKKATPPASTTKVTEASTPPPPVLPEEITTKATTPKRKRDHSIPLLPSGFAPKPRDDDDDEEIDDDETSNVTPLWDNEPYMLEVKASYGCIFQEERIQLDNELFGFEVEMSDMEKLKQDRIQRIRKDREREWNRKESIKLPKHQQPQHGGGRNDVDPPTESTNTNNNEEGERVEVDADGNPIPGDGLTKVKYSDTVEVATAQSLGADCQQLLCVSCEIIVEEFAHALALSSTRVLAARANGGGSGGGDALSTPMYIIDEFKKGGGGGGDAAGGFCGTLPFTHRYSDLVAEVCQKFDDTLGGSRPLPNKIIDPRLEHLTAQFNKIKEGYGYGDLLFRHFERSLLSNEEIDKTKSYSTWSEKILSQRFLSETKRKVCRTMGACNSTNWIPIPTKTRQERWTPQCFVCQALANDLETRLQLLRRLDSEVEVSELIKSSCDRLALTPKEYDTMCRQMISDMIEQPGGERSLDEVAWMAKLHGESLTIKKDRNAFAQNTIKIGKGKGFYPDKLCETLLLCERWETPAEIEKKKLQKDVDAIFF